MAQAGRNVKHYHADNGRFADHGFIGAIKTKDQKITFCGVGAHHQNGIIENKNKSSKNNPAIQGPPISDSKGDKTTSGISSQSSLQTQQAAANQRVVGSPSSNSLRAGSLRDIFGSNPTIKPNTYDSAVIAM